jgi:protein-L-isoaspartate(D-aspartate) O-methyltransferase
MPEIRMADYTTQRANMVDSQVRPSDVTDRRIPRAMLEVPREVFVPAAQRSLAYRDGPLHVSDGPNGGRFLLSPRVLSKMLQYLEVAESDTVLDIGCATGYSAAVLSHLAKNVIAIESDAALAQRAIANLAAIGAANVTVETGTLPEGLPARAPYDAILIEGSIAHLPPNLLDQLKDGGRLVAVIFERGIGKVALWRRYGMQFDHRTLFDAGVAPLPGFERTVEFVL